MNMFRSTFRPELKKFKYTHIIHITYALPIISMLLIVLGIDKFIQNTGLVITNYPYFFSLITGLSFVFFMPFILPAITNRICKIDYRDNTLENLNHSGKRYFNVFLSKLTMAFGSVWLLLNIFFIFQIFLYYLISTWGYAPKYYDLGAFALNFVSINFMAICLIPYLIIHLFLSSRFKWNMLSILISVMLCWISIGIEFHHHKAFYYSPYSQCYGFLMNIPNNGNIFASIKPWYSLGISLIYDSILLYLIYQMKDSIFTGKGLKSKSKTN